MRVIVFGAGGMGGYVGLRLAQAGHDVAFIARGAHLAALRRDGLRLTGAEGEHRLAPVEASDDPAALEPGDAVLFCVKMYDVAKAVRALPGLLMPGGVVLTVQNGIEAPDMVAREVGRGAVLAGTAWFAAGLAGPGIVHVAGLMRGIEHLVFGPLEEAQAEKAAAFAAALQDAGISARVDPSILLLLWRKFCLISATSSASALTRLPIGGLRDDPPLRWLIETAVVETAAVGRARGIALPPSAEADVLRLIDGMAPESRPSQLLDLEAGKPLELAWLSGAVARLGQAAGVPTPYHSAVYAALKPYASGSTA